MCKVPFNEDVDLFFIPLLCTVLGVQYSGLNTAASEPKERFQFTSN